MAFLDGEAVFPWLGVVALGATPEFYALCVTGILIWHPGKRLQISRLEMVIDFHLFTRPSPTGYPSARRGLRAGIPTRRARAAAAARLALATQPGR